MRDKETPSKNLPSIWGRLKRALSSSPDLDSAEASSVPPGALLAENSSNNEIMPVVISENVQIENCNKRQRLNLATSKAGLSEENSFMEMMKNLLSCSICLEVNKYSNQCQNGHLICLPCSGKLQQSLGDLTCPVCRVSLKHGLHRSLLAEQLTSELPAACRYCEVVIPLKHVKNHETQQCSKRMVPCIYKLFGCDWIGKQMNYLEHVEQCSISLEKVGDLNQIVNDNISKDFNLLQSPLQLWKNIISKIRLQTIGSRMIIRQTALTKSLVDEPSQVVFRSPVIRVPFSCCSLHGFYLEITAIKNSETGVEKLQYSVKSENRTKILLNYFVVSIKVDEAINLDVQDFLHNHQFESNHKETVLHEIKLVSLDCDKEIPNISEFESFVVELCFISERERSERGHGILNSNEEEETNNFLNTGSSDSNVVFTLFSPTTSSRSMNTSNTVVIGNDDSTIINDGETSQEDIIITVTENAENGDDVTVENREHYGTRNNHSFVAVPSLFLNPTSVFTYTPFQLDNTFINGSFQQPPRHAREAEMYEIDNQPVISEQETVTLQTGNSNRTLQSTPSGLNQNNQFAREPLRMSLYYPPQTIVSPFTSNSVSPIVSRPSVAPRNIIVRPRHNSNIVSSRQPTLVNNVENLNQVFSEFQNYSVEQLSNERMPNIGLNIQDIALNSENDNNVSNISRNEYSNLRDGAEDEI